MSHFNLIDEKWIPVRYPDGKRDELGIRDALLQAKEIEAIEDPSPLVVAAVHRFLLAVLYRALEGPTDIDQAKQYFTYGFPKDKITAYLEKWRERFWLFDDKYPFYQIPSFEPKTWRAWTVLAAEHNADNAKVLFDHIDVNSAGAVTASSAARWLLATQTFSVSAGKSELTHTGTAPSATAAMVIPIGNNLSDTLLFCLVPQNREIFNSDLVCWEREPESLTSLKNGIERKPSGCADIYTWRTRSILLKKNQNNCVNELAFASGVNVDIDSQIDPMFGYRIDEKKGKLPIQFRERGLWRDFDSLLPDEAHLAPKVIEHSSALAKSDKVRFPKSIMLLGQSNNKAKIEFWRLERYVLPTALASDRFIKIEIQQLLGDADDAQKFLWNSSRTFARNLLSRADREPAGSDISKFIDQLLVNTYYWSTLEARFHEILHHYTLEADPDDIRCLWLKYVRDTLRDAWDQHCASVAASDAWTLRALMKSEGPVKRKLKELNDEIRKYSPQEENA